MRLGAKNLGHHNNVTSLPPQMLLRQSHQTCISRNLRAHRTIQGLIRYNARQLPQQHRRPVLLQSQRLRHQAQCVSTAASSSNFEYNPGTDTGESAARPLAWTRSALAALSGKYQAAVASTRLQTAAFYNPKFLPMVTLYVNSFSASL